MREGLSQRQEAKQEEYSLQNKQQIYVLLFHFPAASLQNNISRAWPDVLCTISLLKQDCLSYLAFCFAL